MENNTSPSPNIPVKQITRMWLAEALKEVLKGKKVTREAWENENFYLFAINGVVHIVNDSGLHSWIVSDVDILAEDWIVVEPKAGSIQ